MMTNQYQPHHQVTYRFAISFDERHLSVFISILINSILITLLALGNFRDITYKIKSPHSKQKEKEILKSLNLNSTKRVRVRLRSKNTTVLTKSKSSKVSSKAQLDMLLSNLTKKSKHLKSAEKGKKRLINADGKMKENLVNIKAFKSKNLRRSQSQRLGLIFDDNFKNIKASNKNENSAIIESLNAKDMKFQECYDRALLVDEGLSGKLNLSFSINKSGRINGQNHSFRGKGGPVSKRNLKKCVVDILKTTVFPKRKSDTKFKFSLLFKS